MEWILIITFYASTMATTSSVSIASVPGFATEAHCQKAGETAKKLETMMKSVAFVCVKTR